MKIAIGALLCEGNSLTPVKTRFEDFDYAPGEVMYEKVAVLDLLQARNCEIVPTLYAHALPGGPVVKADYLRLANAILDGIPADVDGVWLYLHGAMCVEGIGSGEAWLLRALREKIGYKVPVSVSMDFHADNADEIPALVNVVTGYRTAPHTDREQAQRHGVELLFRCLDGGLLPRPQLARANVVICGDAVQTGEEPLKSIMAEAARMEREIPGMLSVQVFNGQPWIDEPYMGPNFVVTHESDTALARDCAEKLARMFWDVRHEFRFEVEALAPDDAIRAAMASEVPVFLSDSGDNTTAGAAGDNAFLLSRLQALGAKNVLLAGIMDAAACDACYQATIGDTLTLRVGGSLDPRSERAEITGRLVHRGDILSYQHDNGGPSATLDCGDMTVVITKNRASLCRPDIFASIDLDYKAFHIVAVKLGYLFPELAAEAQRSILAFTPGASTERLEDMHLKNIRRPMYPLEDDFEVRTDGRPKEEKWYRNSFRRCLVDMHIPDWDDRFLASFDSDAYVDAMRRAGVDAAYVYANSCTGICNWPTKAGHQHNGLHGRDIVGEVTRGLREAGIRPIVYINIWSKWAYEQHPDWRCIDQKGRGTLDYIWNQPGRYGECCMNSPYSDYVLALVDELCQNYDFDGFWVDMILWRMMCFCAHCRRRFKEETGQELPKVVNWQDPVWYQYLRRREAWNEEFFGRIIDRVKSYKPDVTVMCNSSYYPTYFMGESLKYFRMGEFIGGDYSMNRLGHSFECSLFNSVTAHKPFEFLGSVMDPSLYEHSIIKSEEKLASLMFSTLAYNGRYGFIDGIDPTGTLNPRVYRRMHRIFEQERPYEKYLRPEVRFVRDTGLYTNPASCITPGQNGVPVVDADPSAPHMASTQQTALNLMDLHVPFAVLTPYDLDTLGQSRILVLSDLAVVTPAEAEKLRDFVRAGGCLYASGGTGRWDEAGREVPGGALSDLLGVTFEGEAESKVTYIRPEPGHEALLDGYTAAHPLTLDGPQMRARANPGTEVLGRLTLPWVDPADTTKFASAISDPPGRGTDFVSLALSRYGKGRVIYAAGTLEALHKPDQAAAFLRLLRLLTEEPFSFETDAPHCVELTLYEQQEEQRYMLNLVNIQEKLPSVPVYGVQISVRVPQTVRRVRALPEEQEIPFAREEDAVRFTADRIDIFRMFALEY